MWKLYGEHARPLTGMVCRLPDSWEAIPERHGGRDSNPDVDVVTGGALDDAVVGASGIHSDVEAGDSQ